MFRMAVTVRDRAKTTWIAAACLVACGVVAAAAISALGGTKTGAVLALGATIGLPLLYAAIVDPIAFPLGVYALVVPLDEILPLPAVGSIGRVLGAAAGAAMLFYMLRKKRFVDPPKSLVNWLLLYLWMGASLLWAIEPSQSWDILQTALQLLGLYVVAAMFPIRAKQLRLLLYFVVAGGAAAACYALYLFAHGTSIQNRLSISDVNSAGDPNHFAASLLLPFALGIYVLLWHRSLLPRLAILPLTAICFAGILLSGSRGAMLGTAVLVAFLIIRDPHRRVLAAVCSALAAIGALVAGPQIIGRFSQAASTGGAGRTDIWRVGLAAFRENWLFGAGYENFTYAYDRVYIHVFQPIYAGWTRAPHDLLLSTSVELGIVGLVLMLVAWLGQYKTLSPIGTQDPRYGLRLTLQGCLLGMFTIAMFSDIMIRKYLWLLFILIVLTRNAQMEPRPDA